MLQHMTVNHPHSRLLRPQSLCTPSVLLVRLRRCIIAEEHRRITKHRLGALQSVFGNIGIEGSWPTSDVVVVFAVSMSWVDVKPPARFIVDGLGANVLENYFQYFADLSRKSLSRWVEATVLQGC